MRILAWLALMFYKLCAAARLPHDSHTFTWCMINIHIHTWPRQAKSNVWHHTAHRVSQSKWRLWLPLWKCQCGISIGFVNSRYVGSSTQTMQVCFRLLKTKWSNNVLITHRNVALCALSKSEWFLLFLYHWPKRLTEFYRLSMHYLLPVKRRVKR